MFLDGCVAVLMVSNKIKVLCALLIQITKKHKSESGRRFASIIRQVKLSTKKDKKNLSGQVKEKKINVVRADNPVTRPTTPHR